VYLWKEFLLLNEILEFLENFLEFLEKKLEFLEKI